jgi:hypothetical protein
MMEIHLPRVSVLITILSLVGCSVAGTPAERFSSPEAAVARLEDVVTSNDASKAAALLGSDGDYLLYSGDSALDRQRANRFSAMFKERHSLKPTSDNQYVILLGNKGWPFAVPLVRDSGSWIFDAAAGKEEVFARRIGENEFSALDTARTIYLAQREYAGQDWNGDGVYQYAERIISSPGTRDGLYWPTTDADHRESPLSAAVARAMRESYQITQGGEPQPFHGYYHKLLYSAPRSGQTVDLLSKPGQYWLISTPAAWNESGVMTFASNERGWIYEKNLGGDFDFQDVSKLSVDETWTRVE